VVDWLILISYHVVVLNTIEFPFKLPDFGAVCIHLLTGTRPIFVELVDNQRRVPVHHEAFDAKLDVYTETMETCFVFRGVVGGQKVYAENILEFILGRCNEQNSHTNTIDVKGTVKVHHPVLGVGRGDRLLNLGPLSDKISKRLRLDGRPASKFNGVSAELDSPLNDVAIGLFVVENVP